MVSSTLRAALSRTQHTAELLVHSDQGWHYKMQPYRAMLAQQGVKQSMSRKGNCFDNAVIESFFGTLKAEYFHLAAPDSIDALEAGVHDYVHYYNQDRISFIAVIREVGALREPSAALGIRFVDHGVYAVGP